MLHNQISQTEILEGIIEWAEIESPTYEQDCVNGMIAHVRGQLDALGAATETVEISEEFGHALKATVGGEPGEEGGILILGHLDTVHLLGTKEDRLKIRVEGDKLYGPGVFDMKGGLYLAYYAVKKLLAAGEKPKLPITFLCIPEEEAGSPASRRLIEEEAKKYRYVLVPEPARQGRVITGRHAFVRYKMTTRGRPAHAGADNLAGRSAIRAMAKLVDIVESETDMSRVVSFSVGVISGGRFVNVVPIECHAEVLAVASSEENLAYVYDFMATLQSPIPEVELTVEKGPERPLFKPHEGTLALFDRAHRVAGELGLDLQHGQFGGGAHTHEEHLLISSLVPRARLLAGLLMDLD